MNKLTLFFILGAILSPLVLVFGKLIVFCIGLVALIWAWRVWQDVIENMEEENDGNRSADGT